MLGQGAWGPGLLGLAAPVTLAFNFVSGQLQASVPKSHVFQGPQGHFWLHTPPFPSCTTPEAHEASLKGGC